MPTDCTTLYFMRHADAGDPAEFVGNDSERPLSDVGVKRTKRTAKHFAGGQIRPDLVLTSPYVRALQTAHIMADGLHVSDRVQEEPELKPGFDIHALKRLLAKHPDEARIMLVGHESDFSTTISAVIGGGVLEMKKGAIARVDVFDTDKPAGELKWLVTPMVLLG
jgi:phosphohistidine phosphatase